MEDNGYSINVLLVAAPFLLTPVGRQSANGGGGGGGGDGEEGGGMRRGKGRGWTKVTADPICRLMNNSCINSHRDALTERRQEAGEQQGVASALMHAGNHFSTIVLAEEEKTSSCSSSQEEEALLALRLAGSGFNSRWSVCF